MSRNADVENPIPPSQSRPDPNALMKALLERHFDLDLRSPDHTIVNIGNGNDNNSIDDHNHLGIVEEDMGSDLYNSANHTDAHPFLDVLKKISDQKKLHVSVFLERVSLLSGDTLLHVAARYGNANMVDVLVSHFHTLISKKNHKGDTAVHIAAKKGKDSVLQVFYKKRKEFTEAHSSIFCAIANKNVTWTDDWLKLKNKQDNTPLHEALINDHENLAVELVRQDGSVSFFPNKEGKSAFYLAAKAGYVKCLEALLELKDAAPNVIHQKLKGESPVHAAILEKQKDALDMLLKNLPGMIHSIDDEGRTPLHIAAWMGNEDAVDYLLKKSSENTIRRDNNGQLPIHLATMNGHIDVIEILLKQHYNPHQLHTGKGQNILHVAAKSGKYDVVIYILKNYQELNKQLINEKDHDGNTPLHLATMRWHPKIVSALTWDDRVVLNLMNNNGLTALDAAVYYIKGIPTFRQRLTWSALKASGAPQFAYCENLNAGRQVYTRPKLSNTNNYKDKGSVIENKDFYEIYSLPTNSVELRTNRTDNITNPFGNFLKQPTRSGLETTASSDKITNARRRNPMRKNPPQTDSYKERVSTLLLVSTLIATVTFAAGFTVPGGYNNSDPHPGIATMIRHPMFYVFVFCDTIAMFTSLVVAVTLMWAQLGDISLVGMAFKLAVPFLGISLTMMSIAFMSGVYLAVGILSWLAIAILVTASIFIIFILALYFPLTLSFTSRYRISRCITFYFIWLVTFIIRSS